ncbi:uncharacterized protein ANIA_10305 [Aspergillus nidulans FGSC A4]|uniref:Vacuolar ATP synthase 16 kDa proteolipid subunit, putative (AFU_orthologue AFUA_3G12370) n=1 Tax=Emericella nidulans (strain FGSC A4 / ATCC 38163 / CBS 112.46 / NRRL 194 / M139) TaxID=227321 RepID=C8VP73_EMENI|nr:hypothetical protein [Aspergillus nidulans FGSC A4]CBF86890.1 TPA: vacuolar ATP synthase 16 kDa proteolipid subunit, putative (AFU_orthologue; AFUA_3G12370) [Aspergillus nidulans FGSC A4]
MPTVPAMDRSSGSLDAPAPSCSRPLEQPMGRLRPASASARRGYRACRYGRNPRIYGLVVSVQIANNLAQEVALYTSLLQLGAGLAVGLCGLAAGLAIGIVSDAGVRGAAQQPRLYVGMILVLIFAEVLGLYGLIVALLMNARAGVIDFKCR